jgi:hypothetical protein
MKNINLATLFLTLSTMICACRRESSQPATQLNFSDSNLPLLEPTLSNPVRSHAPERVVQALPPNMEQRQQTPSKPEPLPSDGPERLFGTPHAQPAVAGDSFSQSDNGYPKIRRSSPDESRQRRIDEAVQRSRKLHAEREAADAAAVGAGSARGLERATEGIIDYAVDEIGGD